MNLNKEETKTLGTVHTHTHTDIIKRRIEIDIKVYKLYNIFVCTRIL